MESDLRLYTELGHRPAKWNHWNQWKCRAGTLMIGDTHGHYQNTHTPGSMLNFSISRNTCLLSILGWIWSVWCLERDKRGNCLQWSTRKHKPPTNATHAQKELRTHTHTKYLRSCAMLKSGRHQESSSVTIRSSSLGWPLTNDSAIGSLSCRIRGTHICNTHGGVMV